MWRRICGGLKWLLLLLLLAVTTAILVTVKVGMGSSLVAIITPRTLREAPIMGRETEFANFKQGLRKGILTRQMGASMKDDFIAFLRAGTWMDEDLTTYRTAMQDLDDMNPAGKVEGHSGQVEVQQKFYRALARQPFVNTVCEIGFNAGHSSLNWLSAKPGNRLISFDLGAHSYTRPRAEYLAKIFPGQLFIIYGDSTKTVPAFHKTNPDVSCDIVVVDGGHSFENADKDISNMRYLAHPTFNVFVMDDINCDGAVMNAGKSRTSYCVGPEEAIRQHELRGHLAMFEMINAYAGRGFGAGMYIYR